jgi:serine/threonine-protein kinase
MNENMAFTSLLEVLCAEQRNCWHRGEPIRAETYLAQHPLLADQADHVVELIYNEVLLREEMGESPELEDYLQRFPRLTLQLRRLFEVHGVLESGHLLDSHSTMIAQRGLPPTVPVTLPQLPAVAGYELLNELGRGGMGVVYKARHVSLNRVVALKMILTGPHAGTEELARFRAEAEAQARVQHPNIVQIYEIGDAAGCPYFAVEFMDGGSLAQQLAGNPQPPRQAARLLETLAGAVHNAHQHGLVHRDLKPANVLLTADSVAKVTDFGLAKRLPGPGSQPGYVGPTRSGAILGTPSYMAPEQAAGKIEAITPATDIYALGAILYELLTGRPPFLGALPLETLLHVQTQEPVPPRRLQPHVPRDLETICLKCLHKEPSQRYATAQALADDLQRFRADRPIQARPTSAAERLWRWCRRRPAVASLAAALVLALAGSFAAVTSLWLSADANRRNAEANHAQAEQHLADARRENARAEANLEQARQAVEDCFTVAHKNPLLQKEGMQPVRMLLLAAALRYSQEFIKQRQDDPRMQEELARAYGRVAYITDQIGSKKEALAAYQRGRAILQKLAVDQPNGAQLPEPLAEALAGSCNNIAVLQRMLGDPGAALESFQQACAVLEPFRNRPGSTKLHEALAGTYVNLGVLKDQAGEPTAALHCYEQARDLLGKLVQDQPTAPQLQRLLAGTWINIGVLQQRRGERAAALHSHAQAHDLAAKLVHDHPDVILFRNDLAQSQHNIGVVTAEPTAALQALERARDLRAELVRSNPAVTQFRSDLAETYHSLAHNLSKLARPQEALAAYQQAITLQRVAVEKVPEMTQYRQRLSGHYHNLAELLRRLGCPGEAADASRECQKLWPHHSAELYQVACELARCVPLVGRGNPDLTPQEQAQRDQYANQALEALRQALVAGFRNLEQLQQDVDLDPLRSRDDFKKLLAGLAEKLKAAGQ